MKELNLLEIQLINDASFLKIKESLTRMGVVDFGKKKLWQTCNILYKREKYYIAHYKELMQLDGELEPMSEDDYNRRNKIASLLEDWGMLTIIDDGIGYDDDVKLFIIKHSEKDTWTLLPKYVIGAEH